MTERTVHLPVAALDHVDDFVTLATRAEALGYDRVWLPETWGRDAVTTLTTIAERTDEIGIGTSIANVYSRSPALLGQTAATLQEVSDGRFRLGLGPSGQAVIEGWHGIEFGNPLRRTREYVEVVRTVLAGETLNYDGHYFTLGGFRLRCDPPEPAPAVDAAGIGPKSVELAGRFADGWHAITLTPEGIEDRMADFRRGAELGDREPGRVTVSLTCAALDDDEHARDLVRNHLAFYVGAMGTYYRNALARQGYEQVANEVAAAWGSGDRERAKALLDDDLLDELAAAGSPDHARERLGRFEAVDGVDRVAVGFPRAATVPEMERTLAELAP